MKRSLRRLFTLALLAALPLQGQATSSMTCHLKTHENVHQTAHEASHEAAPGHTHQHSHDRSIAADMHKDHGSLENDPTPSQPPSGCALCASCCVMAQALTPSSGLGLLAAAPLSIFPRDLKQPVSVVLEALLRPPRS